MTGTDALARLEPVARALLTEVDRELTTLGAPPAHPVWGALRRVRATPADAVRAVAEWDPARLRSVAQRLRAQAQSYVDAALPQAVAWQGPAAAVYAAHAGALAGHLGGDPGSMAERLLDTARYAEAVAAWFERSRRELAAALAQTLTSAQAVVLRTSPRGSVTAAADIAAHLLAVVAGALAAGEELADAWRPRLGPVRFRAAVTPPAGTDPIDVHH